MCGLRLWPSRTKTKPVSEILMKLQSWSSVSLVGGDVGIAGNAELKTLEGLNNIKEVAQSCA